MKKCWLMILAMTLLLGLGACAGTGTTSTTTTGDQAVTEPSGTASETSGGMDSGGAAAPVNSMAAQGQGKGNCDNVRCAACPEGQTPALRPPNCCACVPVDTALKDCSAVRCAACPDGQHLKLTPPDCCRCIPD